MADFDCGIADDQAAVNHHCRTAGGNASEAPVLWIAPEVRLGSGPGICALLLQFISPNIPRGTTWPRVTREIGCRRREAMEERYTGVHGQRSRRQLIIV